MEPVAAMFGGRPHRALRRRRRPETRTPARESREHGSVPLRSVQSASEPRRPVPKREKRGSAPLHADAAIRQTRHGSSTHEEETAVLAAQTTHDGSGVRGQALARANVVSLRLEECIGPELAGPSVSAGGARRRPRDRRTSAVQTRRRLCRSLAGVLLAWALLISLSSLGAVVSAAKTQETQETQETQVEEGEVPIAAFRIILRPIPSTFDAISAQEVLEVAERVALQNMNMLMELQQEQNQKDDIMDEDQPKGRNSVSGATTLHDIRLDYYDYFLYSRRSLRGYESAVLSTSEYGTEDGGKLQRILQGPADYVVIESTLPVGGLATFIPGEDGTVPSEYEVFALLSESLFPTDESSGSLEMQGLTDALINELGYAPTLSGTVFAVDPPWPSPPTEPPTTTRPTVAPGTPTISPTMKPTAPETLVPSPGDGGEGEVAAKSNQTTIVASTIVTALVVIALIVFFVFRKRRGRYKKEYDTGAVGGIAGVSIRDGDVNGDDGKGKLDGTKRDDDDDDDDEGDSMRTPPTKGKGGDRNEKNGDVGASPDDTAPLSPESDSSSSPSPSPTPSSSADADAIVVDLFREEEKKEQESMTGNAAANTNAAAVAAAGTVAAAATLGAVAYGVVKDQDRSQDLSQSQENELPQSSEAQEDETASDSQNSFSAEAATVNSSAAVSLTPSDAEALHANRNVAFLMMKDQLVATRSSDVFDPTGQEVPPQQDRQIPVPAVNFSTVRRKQKKVHLQPNCLTADSFLNNPAGLSPEPYDPFAIDEDEEQKQATDNESTGGEAFVVTSPSAESAASKVSAEMLEGTPMNPGQLKLVKPKIVASTAAAKKATAAVVTPDNSKKTSPSEAKLIPSPLIGAQKFPPVPEPLSDAVDFDAPDFKPENDSDNDNASDASSISSHLANNPFVLPEDIPLNDEESLMEPPSSTAKSPNKKYRMGAIDDRSLEYAKETGASSANILSSAFSGMFGRSSTIRGSKHQKSASSNDSVGSAWEDNVLL